MKIPTFSMIDPNGDTRRVCVINGQPFYQSTGNSSHLPGAWLPFCGVINDEFTEFTEKIQKPTVAHNRKAKIGHYFPEEIAGIIAQYGPKASVWGRYQNMKCLIITCMLSPDSIHAEIRNAVLDYIKPYKLPTPEWVDSPQPPIPLDDAHVSEINEKLIAMGAEADVDGELLKELRYDKESFEPIEFIQEFSLGNITTQYKDQINARRVQSTVSTDSESDVTDRESRTPSPRNTDI